MANIAAGGPCMCLASSTRVGGLRSPMTSVSHCLSGPIPWQGSVLQTNQCGGSESRISTGIAVAYSVAPVSGPDARLGRSAQVERLRCPAPSCSSAYSGPGRGNPRYACRRGADSTGRIRSQLCPCLARTALRRLGFVHISGPVLDCRCLGYSPRKFGVPTYPLGTDLEVGALVACNSLDYRTTRHLRRCPATLCGSWKYPRPKNARCLVTLAPRAKASGLPSSGRRVISFQQSRSGVDQSLKACCCSKRLCLATGDSSLGIDHPSRQYSCVSRTRSIAFVLHAAENGQYNVSSDGRDGTAAKNTVDAGAELFNLGLQGVPGEDSQRKLAGGVMDNVSSLADGNFRDIATAAMRATISPDIRANEPVEATEAARFSRTLKPDSYPAVSANAETEDLSDVVAQADRLLRKLATAPNADAVLSLISEVAGGEGRVLSNTECSDLIVAALAENNVELAYSILDAMRSSLLIRRLDTDEVSLGGEKDGCWRWPQADVTTYSALVRGLAASLRVSDALEKVADIRRRGVPSGDEVPFGKVVMCPTCKTPLAVVQPQHGIQLVPCAKCRYQYELMSGDVVSCESESLSGEISMFQRGVRVLQFGSRAPAAAVHAVVVRTPGGLARTHRFATATADLPAQEGERVTVALAAPASAGRGIGPLKSSTRAPGWRPAEPMAITNHVTGRVSDLTRAPPKSGSGASFDTSVLVPAAVLLASSDAATALIDPTLPQVIAVGAAAAVALGGAANAFVLPKLNQLPQKAVDATALRQQLLSQHQKLQERLEELSRAAAEEVRMLARMCQLQNKMEAVGIDTYSARIARVKKAREGLDERLTARLELMDNYAKVASMIEIEVEMDVDVLAAEDAGAAASIAEQIERLMEVESLQAEWKLQAEVSDEVERLLRSSPMLPESA